MFCFQKKQDVEGGQEKRKVCKNVQMVHNTPFYCYCRLQSIAITEIASVWFRVIYRYGYTNKHTNKPVEQFSSFAECIHNADHSNLFLGCC